MAKFLVLTPEFFKQFFKIKDNIYGKKMWKKKNKYIYPITLHEKSFIIDLKCSALATKEPTDEHSQ